MGWRVLAPVLPIILVVLIPHAWGSEDTIPFCNALYNWVYNFSELAEMGFDAHYQQADWTWETMVPGWHENRMGKDSLIAAAHNITYVAGQYYQQPSWDYIDFDYSRAVGFQGSLEERTPSPVDEAWWKNMIEDPAVFIANLSLHYPIWGIVWDMELYYHMGFRPPHYSYDQAALDAFGSDTNRSIPVLSANQRHSWLKGQGFLSDYIRWQEEKAFALARDVRNKVHAINPNLSLGLLYFEDAWFHWKILEGFNSSTAPVTGWNEQTYGGYKLGGSEGVDTYQRRWAERGLYGKFIPGIAGPPTMFDRLTAIEAAIRHNGAVWSFAGVYRHDQADDLRQTHVFIKSYLFFNQTRASPLPEFDLYPGVNARPYLGPGGTASIFLNPYGSLKTPPANFTMVTQSPEIIWAGHNLTTTSLSGPDPSLAPGDFPCIISGLSQEDLLPTEALALLSESRKILGHYEVMDLSPPSGIRRALSMAELDYQAGRYSEAITKMLGVRNWTYAFGLEALWPTIEEGLAKPRETNISMNVLRDFSKARNFFFNDEPRKGEILFIQALRGISTSVGEEFFIVIPILVIILMGLNGRQIGQTASSLEAAQCYYLEGFSE